MCRLRATEDETSEADQKVPEKTVVPFINADVVSLLPIAVFAFVVSPLSIQII